MKELGQILDCWRENRQSVLATVVQVSGSAYRRPGARMMILPDGRRIGSVSGGCLEDDVARKAWWLTEEGRPVLRTYDTTSDEGAIWEFGLGCNGVIHVLLERLGTSEAGEAMQYLDEARQLHTVAQMATVIRGPLTGARFWLRRDGAQAGSLAGSPLANRIERLIHRAANQVITLGDSGVFLERVEPPQPFVIFGAGHDAIPLVKIASELGWHVTVADGRPAYLTRERFPAANCLHPVTAGRPFAEVEIRSGTAVVLMTHNYPRDLALLPDLLRQPLAYLGLLGPRSRADRLFHELGIQAPDFVHAPVGLDIGAGSPEAIALAIASEISAVLAARPAGMLRDRQGPIYNHPANSHAAVSRSACSVP